MTTSVLRLATDLVKKNETRFPIESQEYRQARNALLLEEIELRRHIERVAAQRRKLPLSGEVTKKYHFEGKNGLVSFAELFGDVNSLIVYSEKWGLWAY